MQSETQTVREDSSAHQLAPRVRRQAATGEPISIADDYKTFRVAVVIGLVMVAGLSLFLPDKAAGPTYEVMFPRSLESLDLTQHASTETATPVACPSPCPSDAISDRLKGRIGFRGPAGQADAVSLQR